MSTIHLHQTTTLTPEQYAPGLTDFGPGLSRLFGNSADEYLKVHHLGSSEADVTEGSGGVWERLHYNCSDPERIVLETTDSSCGEARQATLTPARAGPTARPILASWSSATARILGLGLVFGTIGKGVLTKAFVSSVKAIESWNKALNKRDRVAA